MLSINYTSDRCKETFGLKLMEYQQRDSQLWFIQHFMTLDIPTHFNIILESKLDQKDKLVKQAKT